MPGMKMCIKLTLPHIDDYNLFIILHKILVSCNTCPLYV